MHPSGKHSALFLHPPAENPKSSQTVVIYSQTGCQHTPPPGFDENYLRRVGGNEVHVRNTKTSDSDVRVIFEVVNATNRNATSVVFTMSILDANENTLAVNPLGHVLNLDSGETKSVGIPLFLEGKLPVGLSPDTDVNLVRWE